MRISYQKLPLLLLVWWLKREIKHDSVQNIYFKLSAIVNEYPFNIHILTTSNMIKVLSIIMFFDWERSQFPLKLLKLFVLSVVTSILLWLYNTRIHWINGRNYFFVCCLWSHCLSNWMKIILSNQQKICTSYNNLTMKLHINSEKPVILLFFKHNMKFKIYFSAFLAKTSSTQR